MDSDDDSNEEGVSYAFALRMLQRSGLPAKSQISEALWVGDLRCAVTEDVSKFCVICVTDAAVPQPNCLAYLRLKLSDGTDVTREEFLSCLEKAVEFSKRTASTGPLLIHCTEGKSRSVALAIGLLMKTKGMSFQEAHDAVVRARKTTRINGVFIDTLSRDL